MVPSRAKAPEQSGALLLRMRVRIVRTVARLPALPDTCAKQPRRVTQAVLALPIFRYHLHHRCREQWATILLRIDWLSGLIGALLW